MKLVSLVNLASETSESKADANVVNCQASATLGYSMYFHRTSWPAALLRWPNIDIVSRFKMLD